MVVQILEEYKNRTEYRLLKDFYDCKAVGIDALQNGVLVLPGILLGRLEKQQLDLLNRWLENRNNQLILTPSWLEMNLKEILHLSLDMKIVKTEDKYSGIPVAFMVDVAAKDVIFQKNGKKFGVHYRRDTGTGLITVVTLPLLDYKLIRMEDTLKGLFDSLFAVKDTRRKSPTEIRDFILKDIHIYLLILAGAYVDLTRDLHETIYRYFGISVDEKTARQGYRDLVLHGYMDDNGLLSKGMDAVKEKRLKSFINAVKQRREKEDEWF